MRWGLVECNHSGGRHLRGHHAVSCHAEIHALKTVPRAVLRRRSKMRRCVLVVVRAKLADGELTIANSRPCAHCCATLRRHGVGRVRYSVAGGGVVCQSVASLCGVATASSGYARMRQLQPHKKCAGLSKK